MDIENVYGVTYVAQWSNFLQRTAGADPTRIALAINWSESYVNNRLSQSPYQIPFAVNPNTPIDIVEIVATLAGWWLWRTRGLNQAKETVAWMDGLHKEASNKLLAIRSGSYPIVANLDTTKTTAPFVVQGCR